MVGVYSCTLALSASGASVRAWLLIFHPSSPCPSSMLLSPLPSRRPALLPGTKPGPASVRPRCLPPPVSDLPAPMGPASRRGAVAKLPTQARDLVGSPLGLGDGRVHGLRAGPELLAGDLLGPVGGVRGLPFGWRRHGGPLLDGRAPGRYYPVDDVPLRLGRPPARAYADDVPRPQGVVWVVDQVALEVLEVLWWGRGHISGCTWAALRRREGRRSRACPGGRLLTFFTFLFHSSFATCTLTVLLASPAETTMPLISLESTPEAVLDTVFAAAAAAGATALADIAGCALRTASGVGMMAPQDIARAAWLLLRDRSDRGRRRLQRERASSCPLTGVR